jgi:hypothetical protein
MSIDELKTVLDTAEQEGNNAGMKFLKDSLGGQDNFPCGFAWVNILGFKGQKISGNTKMGKLLKQVGITQNYGDRKFQIWNPGRIPVQNVYVIEAGAEAAAARDVRVLGALHAAAGQVGRARQFDTDRGRRASVA